MSYVVQEVCRAMILRLSGFFLQSSINANIDKQFEKRVNFPHCPGAMEGKHIVIQKCDGGSCYLNYKNTHLILSLAVVGPDYECLQADLGASCDNDGMWK